MVSTVPFICIYQSEGARTAYFIPERVGEGGPAATESTLFVCLCVCLCVCLFVRRVGRRRRGAPKKDAPKKS